MTAGAPTTSALVSVARLLVRQRWLAHLLSLRFKLLMPLMPLIPRQKCDWIDVNGQLRQDLGRMRVPDTWPSRLQWQGFGEGHCTMINSDVYQHCRGQRSAKIHLVFLFLLQ